MWKKRAWWFYSYRLNDQYKFILNSDALSRSKLTNDYTLKGTFQLNQNNQIIGFYNKRNKLQDRRDFGPTTPLSAARYQASTNYPGKIEWTSVLNNKMFLDVLYGYWGNFFPLRPTAEVGIYEGPFGPGRQDLANNQFFDGGGNSSYQDQKRYKPQFYTSLSYFKDGWAGSHDFKFGVDVKQDKRNFFQDQPFDIFYRDQNGAVNQVDIYNTPVSPVNVVDYKAAWISDTWKMTDRLTVNYGGRLENYKDGWPEQQFSPNGVPALAGWNDATYQAFITPRTISAQTVAKSTTFSPRLGMAYDLTGDNRTVLKAYIGQFRFNSADTVADNQNPVGRAQLRYRFNDLNGNRLLDGPQELNGLVQTVGGAGFVTVDPNLTRPSSMEVSTSLEREVRTGLSARASYVYKNIRNEWNEIDAARIGLYNVPFQFNDIGSDGVAGTADDRALTLLDRPADGAVQPRVHQSRRPRSLRFPDRRSRLESPLRGQVDVADVVWLHLDEPAALDDVDDQRHQRRGQPARLGHVVHLPSVAADVRRQRLRRHLVLELQDHRPLRDAVCDRVLGIVEGAERLPVGPRHQRDVPGRRRPEHPHGTGDREPRAGRRHHGRPPRQVVLVRQVRQADRPGRHVQPAELGHGHRVPHHDRRDVQGSARHSRSANHPVRRALRLLTDTSTWCRGREGHLPPFFWPGPNYRAIPPHSLLSGPPRTTIRPDSGLHPFTIGGRFLTFG